jgi:MFS family permease
MVKKIMLVILMLYLIGTIFGFLSSQISMLIIARLIQGIGIAMFPIAFGIIRDAFPEKKLSIGQGIYSSAFYTGSVIRLPIGEFIIGNFVWRFTFLTIIPIIIIIIVLMHRMIPVNSKKQNSNMVSITNNDTGSQRRSVNKKLNVHKIANIIDLQGAAILSIIIISLIVLFTILSPKSINEEFAESNQYTNFISIALLILLLSASLLSFILIEKRSIIPSNYNAIQIRTSIEQLNSNN